jgi:Kef-type K+ transport system membrane component KefB
VAASGEKSPDGRRRDRPLRGFAAVQPDLATLVIIGIVAVLAPIIADIPRRARIATVVVEILLGIIIGPQVLDLAEPDEFVDFLANLGLAALFFLAGREVDLRRIAGTPLRLAGAGWLIGLVLGVAVGFGLEVAGVVSDPEIVGIALATTALGVLVPILRDAGLTATRFGTIVLAIGAIGELGPIVILSVFLATDNDLASAILLFVFAAIAIGTALGAVRLHPRRISRLINDTMHASGQLAVRICMLLLLALVFLAVELGQDLILGAFAAGLVLGYVTRDAPALDELWPKLDAIGYGLLIPFFFIRSGMTFDLDGLLESPASVAELPLFLALFLVVRGLPNFLARREVPPGALAPLALLSASALPLVVAITEVGVSTGRLASDTAASMVGAAMLSVLIFPALALVLLKRSGAEEAAAAEGATAGAGGAGPGSPA